MNLNTSSTTTVLVYSNVLFNRKRLFKYIPTTVPTKYVRTKNGNIQKKSIVAEHGSIITTRFGDKHKGILFKPIPVGKKRTFPKQLSIRLYLNQHNVHILLFPKCMTLTGCKSEMEATEIVQIFWRDYVCCIPNSTTIIDNNEPTFYFQVVMQNYNGHLGYSIDKIALNDLLNQPEYESLLTSDYCNDGDIFVKIQFPRRYVFDEFLVMVYSSTSQPYLTERKGPIPHKDDKKKKNKGISFEVFSTSSMTMSGASKQDIIHYYNFMLDLAKKYRHILEEK